MPAVPSRATSSDGGCTANQSITLRLCWPTFTSSLETTMRSSALTFLFALVAPLSLGSMACFLSTEGDGYESWSTGDTCDVGSEGCPCTSGGLCNAPFYCVPNQNICAADPCPVGTETCACTPEGVCDPGLLCASDICVDAGCSAGTEGCQCTEGGGCDPGLQCLSGLCVDAGTTNGSGSVDETGTPTDTGTVDETGSDTTSDGTTSGGSSSGGSSTGGSSTG